jgi:hypothetical protein
LRLNNGGSCQEDALTPRVKTTSLGHFSSRKCFSGSGSYGISIKQRAQKKYISEACWNLIGKKASKRKCGYSKNVRYRVGPQKLLEMHMHLSYAWLCIQRRFTSPSAVCKVRSIRFIAPCSHIAGVHQSRRCQHYCKGSKFSQYYI